MLSKLAENEVELLDHSFFTSGLEYCFGKDARQKLIDVNKWNFSGDVMKSASQISSFLGPDFSSCDPVIVLKPNVSDSVTLVQGGLLGKGLKKYSSSVNDSLVYAATSSEVQNSVSIGARMFIDQGYCEYAYDEVAVTFTPKRIVNAGGPYESYTAVPIQLNAGVSGSQVMGWETSPNGGEFDNINFPATTYTPSEEDIAEGMVKLILSAGEGDCQVSDEAFVVLKECDITVQKEVVDNIVRFTATNQNSKLLMSYVWDFGDGHVGRGRFVEHVYDNANTYSVSLQATSDDGFCVKNASSEIVVTDIPTTNYTISGVVRIDESTVLDTGVVGLFYLSPSNNYELKQEVGIEQDGSFMFERLVAKEYYLAARAVENSNYYNSTRPTFYGDTASWEAALVVNPSIQVSGYDITLSGFSIASDETFNKGEDIVRGNVTFDSDFVTKSGTRDIVDDPLPVQDAIILLYDENDNLLSFTTTDEFGDFSFSDLEAGIYVLVIEYIGTSISISQTIIVDGDDSTIDEFAFKITSDEDDETGIFNTSNILQSNAYPNPTSGIVNVGQNNRSYTIYSFTGDVITSGEIGSYQVDLTNLDPGIYLLEIQIDDQKLIERIVKR